MLTAINRHQYRTLRRRFPGVPVARGNETPAAAAAPTPAAPAPAAIDPAKVTLGTADPSAAAPGGRTMPLGNASASFATAIVQRLTAFAIGFPVPGVDDLIDFICTRIEAPLMFDYLVIPDSQVLAAVSDDGIGNSGKPSIIRPDQSGKIVAMLQMRGLETFLTQDEQDIAASMPGWSVSQEQQDKVGWLHGCCRRGKAKRVFALIGTHVAANASELAADVNFAAGNDPIALLNTHINNVADECGYRGDVRILFGSSAWTDLTNNTLVCGGLNGNPRQSVTLQRIADLLQLPVENLMITHHQVYNETSGVREAIFDRTKIMVFAGRKNATRNDLAFVKDFYGSLNGNPLWVYDYNGHPGTLNFGEAYREHLAITSAKSVRLLTVTATQGETVKRPVTAPKKG